MYAIRTRNGNVYLKIKRNFGDMSALQVRACGSPLLRRRPRPPVASGLPSAGGEGFSPAAR
jgi:hypothetical protein